MAINYLLLGWRCVITAYFYPQSADIDDLSQPPLHLVGAYRTPFGVGQRLTCEDNTVLFKPPLEREGCKSHTLCLPNGVSVFLNTKSHVISSCLPSACHQVLAANLWRSQGNASKSHIMQNSFSQHIFSSNMSL